MSKVYRVVLGRLVTIDVSGSNDPEVAVARAKEAMNQAQPDGEWQVVACEEIDPEEANHG